MRRRLIVLAAVFTVVLVAIAPGAEAKDPRGQGEDFTIVYLNGLEPRSLKARIRTLATKDRVAVLQREINADPVLMRQLRAHGIQIRNIIGRDRAMNGRTIFYLR